MAHVNYDTIFDEHSCKICGQFCKNRRSLGNHLARSHDGYDVQAYLLEFYLGGQVPKCACGCGSETSWKKNRYQYGEFVNGHNNRFSSDNQPDFTPEQVEKRIQAIKNAYEVRGTEIREKISESLVDAWQNEKKRVKWETARKDQWQRNGWSGEDISVLRKRVWKEQYSELYDKIFTADFRKKISLANMKRGMKHSSKKEKEFVKILRDNLPDKIAEDYWVNYEGGAKCFDVYLPEHNTLIEFDGIFWHGHDRRENYTLSQLVSMTNDMRKNQLARVVGKKLIRVRSDSNWRFVTSLQDLLECSYFIQEKSGEVTKEDANRKLQNTQNILSRNLLLKQNHESLGGHGKAWTQEKYLPILTEFLKAYVDEHGWFYPESDESLSNVLTSVRVSSISEDDERDISSQTSTGTRYLKARLRSFWDVQNGPVEAFQDDKKLAGVLRYRLGLNNSKMYRYKLDDGSMFETNEHFDINIKNIRRGFIVQRHAVSFFKPSAACSIYRRLIGNVRAPRVWDPSAGFGGRMLGFAAAYPEGEYVATEPATLLHRELTELADDLVAGGFLSKAEIIHSPSESVELTGEFDLIFTSPPYFDKEKYFDEPGQCWRDYPAIGAWKESYLIPTLQKARSHISDTGYIVINVSQDLEQIVCDAAEEACLHNVDRLELKCGRDHFSRKKGIEKTLKEPILVFVR